MIITLITIIFGGYGIYGIFTYQATPIVIGGLAAIINLVSGLSSGQLKSLTTTIVFSAGGIIWSSSIGAPFWIGLFAGLCWENLIMGIFGLISLADMKNNS